MFSPITLDALRTLDAIDRKQSFAAAADELFRVPSAVSYTVNKLEEDLGVQIFDRSRRKAELTPIGRMILQQGRQILLATEELTAMARLAADGWEVELKIAVDSVIDTEFIYPLLEQFQQLQPRTEVRLLEEVLGGSWDALSSERCDLVIGAEGEAPHQGFDLMLLGNAVFEFAVAAEHPLTQLTEPLPLELMAEYPTVVVADSSRNLPVRSTGLLDGRSRLIVPSMAQKIAMQKQGLGVGYLPLHRIQAEIASGELHLLTLAETRKPLPISVAWRKGAAGKALLWFIEQLRSWRLDPVEGMICSQGVPD